MGDTDYVYGAISNVSTNAFDITNAVNSGDISGTAGAYIPAYSVSSVTEGDSGEIAAAAIDNPSNGNVQLHSIVAYAQSGNGQGNTITNVTFTVPTGAAGGAGGYTSKESINPPFITVVGLDGSGTSQSVSATLSLNTTTNRNVITIGGTDTLGIGIVYRLQFN